MKVEDITPHKTPPGGWVFRQPETNWVAPTPIASTLNQTAMLVQAMRRKNLAIVAKFKLSTDLKVIESEVLRFNRKRLGLPEEATPIPFLDRNIQNVRGAVVAAGDWIRKTATGIATLADWLPDGVSVPSEVSEQRASICVDCPKNNLADIMLIFTGPVVNLIKRQLQERKQLDLRTSHDDRIGTCDACGCPMKLKLHIPLDTIKAKMKRQEVAKLDPRCWITKET